MRKYQPITMNRRAKFDFAINYTLLAGLVLIGTEVKSVRNGKTDLKGSFASIKNDELWLNNAFIPASYQSSADHQSDPNRARKLLVHKRELNKLIAAKQSGSSLVPLSLGKQGRFIKLELGVGKSRKRRDKREVLKHRTARREADRYIKGRK